MLAKFQKALSVALLVINLVPSLGMGQASEDLPGEPFESEVAGERDCSGTAHQWAEEITKDQYDSMAKDEKARFNTCLASGRKKLNCKRGSRVQVKTGVFELKSKYYLACEISFYILKQ